MQEVGNTRIGHHGIENTVVGEEVAHQQQRNELRHRNGHHEQGTPELGELGLFIIDEHCHQNAAKEVGKGGKECPNQRPG